VQSFAPRSILTIKIGIMKKVIYFIKKSVDAYGEHSELLKSLFLTKGGALIELEKQKREYNDKGYHIAPVEGKNNAFLAINEIMKITFEYGEVEITI
jgi:hypothetical protein